MTSCSYYLAADWIILYDITFFHYETTVIITVLILYYWRWIIYSYPMISANTKGENATNDIVTELECMLYILVLCYWIYYAKSNKYFAALCQHFAELRQSCHLTSNSKYYLFRRVKFDAIKISTSRLPHFSIWHDTFQMPWAFFCVLLGTTMLI